MDSRENDKTAVVFVDGQNLFHTVREAFGYTYPNYDILKLAQKVCESQGWALKQVRFYTGVPNQDDDAKWHHFWTAKLLTFSRAGVYTFSRPLRYRNKVVNLPDGTQHSFSYAEEKGIDVRIAVDVLRMAIANEYEVAVIFSQDQDLSEVAKEIRSIAQEEKRWIKVASAFPHSAASKNKRGIDQTDWIRIDRATYDSCIDKRDYRQKS